MKLAAKIVTVLLCVAFATWLMMGATGAQSQDEARLVKLEQRMKQLETENKALKETVYGSDEESDVENLTFYSAGIAGQVDYLSESLSRLEQEPSLRHYLFVENAKDELENLALPKGEREEGLLHGSWSDYYGLMPYWTAEAGLTKEAAEEARLSAKIYRRAKDLGWVDTDRGEYEGLSDLSRPQSVSGHN